MESIKKTVSAEEYLESKTQEMWHGINDVSHVITIGEAREYASIVKKETIEGLVEEIEKCEGDVDLILFKIKTKI